MVLQVFQTATVALSEMRDTIWASQVAQGEFDRLRVSGAKGADVGNGYWSGRFSTYYSDFIWDRNVRDAGLSQGVPGGADVRHVVMNVHREGSSRGYRYDTYVRISKKPEEPEANQ